MKPLRFLERALWSSRFLMLAAVIFSALMALGAFYMAVVDTLLLPGDLRAYSVPGMDEETRADLRAKVLTHIVKAVDGYIVAAILLIFALGLYELFLGKLEVARDSEVAPRLLHMGGLEDLKDRIAKLLLLILVIEFFQRALRLDYEHALDLLYLAMAILLIGVTLYLGKLRHSEGGKR